MIKSNDPKALINLLENTKTTNENNSEFRTEYMDAFDDNRLKKFDR